MYGNGCGPKIALLISRSHVASYKIFWNLAWMGALSKHEVSSHSGPQLILMWMKKFNKVVFGYMNLNLDLNFKSMD